MLHCRMLVYELFLRRDISLCFFFASWEVYTLREPQPRSLYSVVAFLVCQYAVRQVCSAIYDSHPRDFPLSWAHLNRMIGWNGRISKLDCLIVNPAAAAEEVIVTVAFVL